MRTHLLLAVLAPAFLGVAGCTGTPAKRPIHEIPRPGEIPETVELLHDVVIGQGGGRDLHATHEPR